MRFDRSQKRRTGLFATNKGESGKENGLRLAVILRPAGSGALEIKTVKLVNLHLDFSQQYLQATLFVSLLSVWVLVGLFYYLNRYTRREYFTIWTVAWLFYALWLTLGLTMQGTVSGKIVFILIGLGSVFAGVCFYRVRKKMPFVGAGMLSLGFFLWGVYLSSYPFSQKYQNLYNAG